LSNVYHTMKADITLRHLSGMEFSGENLRMEEEELGDFFALRGGRHLNEGELKSHLLLASRLENIGVFLGAGASRSSGGMLVTEVWKHFRGTNPDSLNWLLSERFIAAAEAEKTESSVNLEKLLDILGTTEREWQRLKRTKKLQSLVNHRNNLYRALLRGAILDESLWSGLANSIGLERLRDYRMLLTRLMATRRPGQEAPWLFSTNYDLAIEWACESLGLQFINGFTGLHNRTFSPNNFDLGFRNMRARGEARFGSYHIYLAKLHGSLSWIPAEGFSVRELSTEGLYDKVFRFIRAESSIQWPGLMILPNSNKYLQTTSYVLGELIRRFAEFLARPQTCLLISGYSFGDEHLNRVLLSALQNPTLHLVLYVPEFTHKDDRQSLRPWLRSVLELQLPRVTIVGGQEQAFFSKMVERDLPEPALLDDEHERTIRMLRILEKAAQSEIEEHEEQVPAAAAREGADSDA